MTAPDAAFIIIGNEILSGRTQDKNLSWLAEHLNDLGIPIRHVRIIPDVEETIIDTVNELRNNYTYIFTSGGIGPTHDDITSLCIAKAFGVALTRHPEAQRRLEVHYPPGDLNEARLKMADIPQGATLIDNPVSAAPGFQIDNVFVLAGVPKIMQAMVEGITDRLSGGKPTLSRTLSVAIPEGDLAKAIGNIQDHFPEVEIGSYPRIEGGRLSTSLVFRSTDEARLEACVTGARHALYELGVAIRDIT